MMNKWVLPQTRNTAYCMVAIPATVVFVSAVFMLLYQTWVSYSVCLGGITWVLPNLYFVSKAFSNMRPDALNKIMKNFFLAEFSKLAFTALLAVLILKFIKVKILFFFIGYVIAQLVFWLTPFLLNRVKKA